MTDRLEDWMCANCDEWKDCSDAGIIRRNGQRVCHPCYERKFLSQKRRMKGGLAKQRQTSTSLEAWKVASFIDFLATS